MKTLPAILLLCPLCCCAPRLQAQVNLAPNPSFEEYILCPDGINQMYKVIGWDDYLYSPDWFHSCATFWGAGVPNNGLGYQVPASGDAYCGFITYNTVGVDREIIGIQLTDTLSISQKYFISFMVSQGGHFGFTAIATNKTGARFYTLQPDTVFIDNWAHFYTDSIITDTANWTRLFGSFVADSAYQYLLLGNFFDDSNTDTIHVLNMSGPLGYYYIDDVCVSTDSALCYSFTGMDAAEIPGEEFAVFPNPANHGTVTIQMPGEAKKTNLHLYDMTGRTVRQIMNIRNVSNMNMDISNLPAGVYFIIISTESRDYSAKLLITP